MFRIAFVFGLFLYFVLASLHFVFRFRLIFFLLQTVINISDAGCWRCVCRAAEAEVTKTGVNIYEGFSIKYLTTGDYEKEVCVCFFFQKNSVLSGKNKQKVSMLE